MVTTIMSNNEMAEPNGQLLATPNCDAITRPIMLVLPPPINSTVMYEPTDGTNTRIEPASTPGIVIGSITRVKALNTFAPRSWAASNMDQSNFSREAYSGRIM